MKPVLYCTCYNMNTHTYYVSTIYINMQINYPTKHSTPKRKFDFEFLQNIPEKARESYRKIWNHPIDDQAMQLKLKLLTLDLKR